MTELHPSRPAATTRQVDAAYEVHFSDAGLAGLGLKAVVEPVACKSFPSKGARNTFTPMRSGKIKPLRPWKEALGEYSDRISRTSTGGMV